MATQSDGGDLTRPEPVREAGYRAAEQGADCTGSDALRLAHQKQRVEAQARRQVPSCLENMVCERLCPRTSTR